MQAYFALIPAIASLAITVSIFNASLNKENETVWRAWCFILGIVFVLVTTFFFNLGAEEVQKFNKHITIPAYYYGGYNY